MSELAALQLETVHSERRVERPWWRLHASSWVLALLLLLAMTLIVVPGECSKREIQQVNLDCEHGWPLAFYENSFVDTIGLIEAPLPPDWLRTDCWRFDGVTSSFYPMGLLADALAAGLVVGVPVAVWESRRRRRKRALQFSLAGLMIAMLLVGATVNYWVRNRQRRAAEDKEITRLGAGDMPTYRGRPGSTSC